ncbi:1-(5-phosphoribosyl)-5-[(5-phosphoribosylamino) methylideneamino] imidazole-4-carboxamide isomerase [Abditibacteriota bacterium]|nr:1-(5-phosphoribosyl)-5-[(5-phosphoribosylamino) methylideneamino] imidazole-4-carboxamide isomerase [Abditibacteriota bacterium]
MPFEIIPAIDIRGGKCVRLMQGDYARETVYGDDPVEMAKRWAGEGAPRLHIVDLDGAREGSSANFEAIQNIVKAVQVPVQVGGGIRSFETLDALLDAGVQRCILGTVLAKNQSFAEEAFAIYADAVIAGIDARDGKVAVEGWQETSAVDAVRFASYMEELGAMRIIFTDIGRDGMLTGPNTGALISVCEAVSIPVIASGGVQNEADVIQLRAIEGIEGMISGKALYEGTTTLRAFLKAASE